MSIPVRKEPHILRDPCGYHDPNIGNIYLYVVWYIIVVLLYEAEIMLLGGNRKSAIGSLCLIMWVYTLRIEVDHDVALALSPSVCACVWFDWGFSSNHLWDQHKTECTNVPWQTCGVRLDLLAYVRWLLKLLQIIGLLFALGFGARFNGRPLGLSLDFENEKQCWIISP